MILTSIVHRMASTDPAADTIDNPSRPIRTASLAALREEPRYRPGPPCGMRLILNRIRAEETAGRLEPGVHAELLSMVDDESVSATVLAAYLADNGYSATAQKVSRHRRRSRHSGCRCPR